MGKFLLDFLKGAVLGSSIYNLGYSLLVIDDPISSLIRFIVGIFNMGVFFVLKSISNNNN